LSIGSSEAVFSENLAPAADRKVAGPLPPRGGGLGRGGGSAGTSADDDRGNPPPRPSPTRGEGELGGVGGSPFWTPDRHADRRPRLLARARSLTALRAWFSARGFLEVEPAALQVSPGNETHLHGFATELITGDGARHRAYLHTSPEFALKKLLAAGETKIFALSKVFRNRERTPLHAPEFTMLEWYRVGEGLEALMMDCAAVLQLAAGAAGSTRLRFRGREADPFAEPERLSVREGFLRYAGIDLFDSLGPTPPSQAKQSTPQPAPSPAEERSHDDGSLRFARNDGSAAPDRDKLAAAVAAKGMRVADDDSWSDLFSRVLSEKVEPNLGIGQPTFLTDYPATEAALARLSPDDPRIAQRFELYACGVELANAFDELTDAEEQRRRFEEDMALKSQLYGESYPLDEDFLRCLPYMKATCGAALGFDRVAMLACGADNIEDVQWTPVFRP
jgi:lysyl-tRNA synthetase class 2